MAKKGLISYIFVGFGLVLTLPWGEPILGEKEQ